MDFLYKKKKYDEIIQSEPISDKDKYIKSLVLMKKGKYVDAIKLLQNINSYDEKILRLIKEKLCDAVKKYWEATNEKKHSKIIKYPTTPHFPFSDGVYNDDKIDKSTDKFTGKKIVITEKLDGENCCLYKDYVFARTHSHQATHTSFDTIKEMYYGRIQPMIKSFNIPLSYAIFGENMTAIHCLEYSLLESYFYIFAVFDTEYGVWLSWNEVEVIAEKLNIPTVPVIYKGFATDNEIEIIVKNDTQSQVCLNSEREGCVVRISNRFTDFYSSVSKYVRYGLTLKSKWTDKINKPKIKKTKIPKITILVGFPGSGKSTFTEALKNSDEDIVVINQDKLGSLTECEKQFCKYIKKKKIVVDRCNLSKVDRDRWIDLSFKKSCVIVHFDVPINICKLRVRHRQNHETLNRDSKNVFDSLKKMFEPPQSCIRIKSKQDVNRLLNSWNCCTITSDIDLIKYPRIKHFFDIREVYPDKKSSITGDDLIVKFTDRNKFFNKTVCIEEKINGINIGITYDLDTDSFKIQRGSKYINNDTNKLYEKLYMWIYNNRNDLLKILESGDYTLFGVWCEKNNINDNLSYMFVSFDILDRTHDRFINREKFNITIGKTNITPVPVITYSYINSIDDLKIYLETDSEFTNSKIEGIVIRVDDDKYLENICKVIN